MIGNWRASMAAAAAALVLAACSSWSSKDAGTSSKEAVAEPPCSAARIPAKPAFPADSLTGGEDIFTLGVTLWADRKARRAYELLVETALKGCTDKTP